MNFTLRNWKKTDAQSVQIYANNETLANNLRDGFPFPYTIEDAHFFIDDCLNSDTEKRLMYAIEVEGHAVGSIGVFLQTGVFRKSGELGYWLGQPYWGQGIMRHAIAKTCQDAFSALDIERIFAQPYTHNIASRKVLEHAGFSLEGVLRQCVLKNGTLQDSCMYALLKYEIGA